MVSHTMRTPLVLALLGCATVVMFVVVAVFLANNSTTTTTPGGTGSGTGSGGAIYTDAVPGAQGTTAVGVSGTKILVNGAPTQLFGVRVAAAALTDELEASLLKELPEYRRYGVNSFTVFYQGCSALNANPFTTDGTGWRDAKVRDRMDRIIAKADSLRMVVVVGIFYKNAPKDMTSFSALTNAVKLVAGHLRTRGAKNIILNIANEQSIFERVSEPYATLAKPSAIIELCKVAKQVHPTLLVGGGGFDKKNNVEIGRAAGVDVLLFDGGGCGAPGSTFDEYRRAGVNKPMIHVELTATSSDTKVPGCFGPGSGACSFAEFYRQVDDAVARPDVGVFLHTQNWFQHKPPKYNLGGDGQCSNSGDARAGIRWWFEYVAKKSGAARPQG